MCNFNLKSRNVTKLLIYELHIYNQKEEKKFDFPKSHHDFDLFFFQSSILKILFTIYDIL